jgi:hypothetical protein
MKTFVSLIPSSFLASVGLLITGASAQTAQSVSATPIQPLPQAIAQSTTQPIAQPTIQPTTQPSVLPATEVGFEFEGISSLNYAPITETTYTGDCPGVELDRSSFKARFRSSKTPTGEHRRVMIQNITTGMASDPAPYTNREYHKGRLSEATETEFGTQHSSKKFRVGFGMNTLAYEIREQDKVLESGQFTSNFERLSKQVVRDAQWYNAKVCANNSVATEVCADLRREKQFRCPNGKILQRERLDSDDSGIRTLISNQSNRIVRFKIDNEQYRLEPGERTRIRRYSTNSFGLNYNGDCPDCKLQQSVWVTPGKRLKFIDRGSSSSGKRVDLVDYPYNSMGNEE